MIYNFSNGGLGKLAAGITSIATGITITTGDEVLFPASNFLVVVWNRTAYSTLDLALKASAAEFMHVATRTGTAFSGITRAQESTLAQAFNTGGQEYWAMVALPASVMNDLTLLNFICPDDNAKMQLVPRLVSSGVYSIELRVAS